MMMFCLSVCSETKRAILDLEPHGDVLAMLEGGDLREARQAAEMHPALDGFRYREGWGWERRGPTT